LLLLEAVVIAQRECAYDMHPNMPLTAEQSLRHSYFFIDPPPMKKENLVLSLRTTINEENDMLLPCRRRCALDESIVIG
jgi:hypothetical protein